MQLYALEGTSPLVAGQAERRKNYICPECGALVRVRSGPHRQIHFYHPSRPKNCRQHQKSEEHLQLQLKLLRLIGAEQGQLECHFTSINRIADVAWHERKIIFEIQCSPISLEEVRARNRDYSNLGYQVIWILHTKQFNKSRLSAAENYLRYTPCYYTDIDRTGNGMVYDQFEIIKEGRRLFKGPPLCIPLIYIERLPETVPPDLVLPKSILVRLSGWKCYARGDLLHRLLCESHISESAKKMLTIETRLLQEPPPSAQLPLSVLLSKSYKLLLDFLLKKVN